MEYGYRRMLMTDYVANYWKSDQIAPEVLKEMFQGHMHRMVGLVIHSSKYAKFNEETNSVEIGFDCDSLGIEISDDGSVTDIINDVYEKVYNHTEGFLYQQLLNKVEANLNNNIDSASKGLATDIIWRICQYIGANSDTRYRWNDNNVWERIHL